MEHLGDAVVGEGGQFVDVVERAVGCAVEAGPQIRHQDLGALVDVDPSAVEDSGVAEAREGVHHQIDQGGRRLVGLFDAVDKRAVKTLVEHEAGFSQYADPFSQQRHGFWSGRAEDVMEHFIGTLNLVLPKVRAGDGDAYRSDMSYSAECLEQNGGLPSRDRLTFIQGSLERRHQGPIPRPPSTSVFHRKGLVS